MVASLLLLFAAVCTNSVANRFNPIAVARGVGPGKFWRADKNGFQERLLPSTRPKVLAGRRRSDHLDTLRGSRRGANHSTGLLHRSCFDRRGRAGDVRCAFTEADYLADPADISAASLPDFKQRDVFLHFHGRGGPDREDADLQARVLAQDAAAGLDRFVHVFVWRGWLDAATTERISYTGQAIGRKIGEALAEREDLRSLHVTGTSAGGFAANECISAYVAAAGERRATTRLSLFDPFCARADEVAPPWDNGLRTSGALLFGRDADFAEHYLNRDDIVPSTNFPLPLCHCYDVTGAAERASFPPPNTGNFLKDIGVRLLGYHNWPIGYFARHYETTLAADGAPALPNHEDFPRGAVSSVP